MKIKDNKALAKKELRKKLLLETKLKRELTRIFKEMSTLIYINYLFRLSLPNLDKLYAKTERAIHKHYVAVSKAFDSHYRDRHDVTSESDALIDKNIDAFIKTNVPLRSRIINGTTQDQMKKSHISAISELLKKDGTLDNNKTALLTKRNFLKLVLARTVTIAMSETQLPAESTKHIESDVIIAATQTIKDHKKEWVTVGDNKVRISHADADGQIVDARSKFQVGGEMLRFPGDWDNGSTWNVINCRCTAVYFK